MHKTTVYLPEELRRALRRLGALSGRSEAELIREAIAEKVFAGEQPRPRGGLFAGGGDSLAEHADAALAGFGER